MNLISLYYYMNSKSLYYYELNIPILLHVLEALKMKQFMPPQVHAPPLACVDLQLYSIYCLAVLIKQSYTTVKCYSGALLSVSGPVQDIFLGHRQSYILAAKINFLINK